MIRHLEPLPSRPPPPAIRALACLALLAAGCTSATADEPTASRASALAPADDGVLVQTHDGSVRGVLEGSTLAWRGVPYAAPPVGALRWALPQPAPTYPGVRDASSYAPICDADGSGSEDCLYVNVFAPATARPGSSLPVAFFIHGGYVGAGDDTARALTDHGVVVVTINFRLGLFGFLGHAGLTAESGTSGNWAFYDMIEGLRWVRRNVDRFGGDGDRVMIFGQSLGAKHVNTLLASPPARDLFHRAILESQSLTPGQTRTLSAAESEGATLAATVGCAGTSAEQVACLRALPATAVDAQGLGTAVPSIDGRLLLDDVAAVVARDGARVPIVIGTTTDENSTSLRPIGSMTPDEVAAAVQSGFPTIAASLLQVYPLSAYATPLDAYIALESDLITCKARWVARAAASARDARPVYRYLFTHVLEDDPLEAQLYGAWHGEELGFLTGDIVDYDGDVDPYEPTPAELVLAQRLQAAWARFAATGDPNGPGARTWPSYAAAIDDYERIDDVFAAGAHFRSAQCDVFDAMWSTASGRP
jgi:para-nitrobenzyl esterase